MTKDNIEYTQKENYPGVLDITGTYSINVMYSVKEVLYKSCGQEIRDEIKSLIEDQLRKQMTADILDVGYLKLLYEKDSLRKLIANTLDKAVFETRTGYGDSISKENKEKVKMLDEVIYKLRTYNEH